MEIYINDIRSPVKMTIGDSGLACFSRNENKHQFTSDELKVFRLKHGVNKGSYRVPSLRVVIHFLVYYVEQVFLK